MIPFWLGLAGVAATRAALFSVETELSACGGPCCSGPRSKSSLMWIDLLSFTFELLQSLLGERSENVVRSNAKRGEGHGKEFPSLAKWAIKSCVFRSLTLAPNTIIAPGEQKLAACCPW